MQVYTHTHTLILLHVFIIVYYISLCFHCVLLYILFTIAKRLKLFILKVKHAYKQHNTINLENHQKLEVDIKLKSNNFIYLNIYTFKVSFATVIVHK